MTIMIMVTLDATTLEKGGVVRRFCKNPCNFGHVDLHRGYKVTEIRSVRVMEDGELYDLGAIRVSART